MQPISEVCHELDVDIGEFLIRIIDGKMARDDKIYSAIVYYAEFLIENAHPRLKDHGHISMILTAVLTFQLKSIDDFRTMQTLTHHLPTHRALLYMTCLFEKLMDFTQKISTRGRLLIPMTGTEAYIVRSRL